MKKILFLSLFLSAMHAFAQKPSYDSVLAKKLGADDYGMKMYTMVILTTGKADIADKKSKDSLFAGHMANIGRLAKNGSLALAGPFGKNDINYRGVFVFNNASVEATKQLVETDPAVKAGLYDAIYIPWYCSAGLMEVNSIHEKIQKVSF